MDRPVPGPREMSTSGSLKIARIDGVDIRIHWSFLLLLALIALATSGSSWRAAISVTAWILAIFACVVFHELAHSIVARRRGATVLGILLLPIGGMSQLDKVPDDPSDEFAISVVGPLSSLALGAGFAALALAVGDRVWPPSLVSGSWLVRLAWLNVLLAAFNMLPALPMDGGRVLRSSLARHHDHLGATIKAARVARILAFTMIAVGILFDLWLILIGFFVLFGANAELLEAEHHATRSGHAAPS